MRGSRCLRIRVTFERTASPPFVIRFIRNIIHRGALSFRLQKHGESVMKLTTIMVAVGLFVASASAFAAGVGGGSGAGGAAGGASTGSTRSPSATLPGTRGNTTGMGPGAAGHIGSGNAAGTNSRSNISGCSSNASTMMPDTTATGIRPGC
jgi:hypothetical protein